MAANNDNMADMAMNDDNENHEIGQELEDDDDGAIGVDVAADDDEPAPVGDDGVRRNEANGNDVNQPNNENVNLLIEDDEEEEDIEEEEDDEEETTLDGGVAQGTDESSSSGETEKKHSMDCDLVCVENQLNGRMFLFL